MNFRRLNLIWNWKELIQLEKEKWQGCVGLHQQWHGPPGQGSGLTHFGLSAHEVAEQRRAPGFTGQWWPAKSRRLPTSRCSGEGSGSKLAGRQTTFGAVERRGLTGWAWPWRSGAAAGEKRWQARVEVIGAVGTVREELLSLEKVTTRALPGGGSQRAGASKGLSGRWSGQWDGMDGGWWGTASRWRGGVSV
jgi:hypothetical protein